MLKIVNNADGASIAAVDTFEPIVNEFGISITRATVAMAKLPGDPDSATSQWFVNLSDNSVNLDNQNGGFAVFGRIINDEMSVFDAIADLPVNNFGGSLAATPTIDFDGKQLIVNNLVRINSVEVINPTGIFNENLLSFVADIGTDDFFAVSLQLVEVDPEIVFELDFSSIMQLQESQTNVATFSMENGTLNIPSVMVNNTSVVNNVLFSLTN